MALEALELIELEGAKEEAGAQAVAVVVQGVAGEPAEAVLDGAACEWRE